MSVYSTFLFARASTIEGIARSMDLGATLQEYNNSKNEIDADRRALFADFLAISEDLNRVLAEITEKEKIKISDELISKANAMLSSAFSTLPALTGETEINVKSEK